MIAAATLLEAAAPTPTAVVAKPAPAGPAAPANPVSPPSRPAASAAAAGPVQLADYSTLVAEGYGTYIAQLQGAGYTASQALLQAQFKQAVDEVHALAESIAAAQRAGQGDAVTGLRQQLAYWLAAMNQAKAAAAQADQPSRLMLALSQFADEATAAARAAGVALPGLLANLPGLLVAVAVIAVLALIVRLRG